MASYRFGLKDVFHIGFIAFALVMSGLLVDRYYLRGGEDTLEVPAERLGKVESESNWYGIYMRDKKIGYSQSTTTNLDSQLVCTDRTYLEFTMVGRRQAINSYSRAVVDSRMNLQSFIFTLSGQDTDFGVRGRVDGEELALTITMAGESRGEIIELDEPIQLPNTVQLLLEEKGFEPGAKYSTQVFDPSSMKNVPLEIEVVGRESIEFRGTPTEVTHVRQNMGGLGVDSYFDSEGNLLVERSGMGYRLVLEDESTAAVGDWATQGTDIQKLVAVVPDVSLADARRLARLRIELSGIGEDTLVLRGGPQQYEKPILDVTIQPPAPPGPADTLPTSVRDASLAPGSFVQSEHPRLLAVASQIIDLQASDVDKIRGILIWLEANIAKKPTFSIPNTLEVLERRSGDCNEFAVLFASLARAAGIPTRIAMGLVYVEDAFYYHAWCECWLNDWIPVDPVFGQFPADATHLRFIAGDMDRQVEILPLVGSLGIRVLDSSEGLESVR